MVNNVWGVDAMLTSCNHLIVSWHLLVGRRIHFGVVAGAQEFLRLILESSKSLDAEKVLWAGCYDWS